MYEDMNVDNGIAYNTENFDDENYFNYSEGIECEGIYDECPYGIEDDEKLKCYCKLVKECKAGEL